MKCSATKCLAKLPTVFTSRRFPRCDRYRPRTAPALVALAALAPACVMAFPFQAKTTHPRIFFDHADIPVLAARVGIQETGMPPKTVLSWQSHMTEWERVTDRAWDAPDGLELQYTSGGDDTWSKTDARKVEDYLAAQAVVYFLTQGEPESATMAQRLKTYLRDIVNDARSRNGGSIGPSINENDWGKNAVYKGFCMAYDYLHPWLMSHDPGLATDYAKWLYAQAGEGYEFITSQGEDITEYRHYYKNPWIADGVVGALLTIWGDLPQYQADIEHKLGYALDFKWEDFKARAENYVGTYSGYREERVEEDLITAALISSCLTSHDPLDEFANHFSNIDDWVMHMTRGDGGMSDETGDKMDLGPLRGHFKVFPYISAGRDRDGATLWALDRIQALDGEDAYNSSEAWVYLLWNDKTIPRDAPGLGGAPLSRYFGDLTWDDGGNSQYAHFRSHWSYTTSGAGVVMASFLCGPVAEGHDLSSNGHFAIFRGRDILTASTGVYDGTAFDHTRFYNQPAISENTVVIYDPNSPYANDDDEGFAFRHSEGYQGHPPNSTGGNGVYMSYQAYDYLHSMGNVTKFAYVTEAGRQVARLEADLTEAYPNTRKADLWDDGQVVDSVFRDFLFLSGKYFVVYDRIDVTSASYRKSIVIHSPVKEQPRLLDGSWNGGVQPHPGPYGGTPGVWTSSGSKLYWEKGDSRLFITSHLPSLSSGRRILAIGGTNSSGQWNKGSSYEFWLRRNEENHPWRDDYLGDHEIEEQVESGWAGWWRLEIEPSQNTTEDRFLTLLEPAPKSQQQPTRSERLASDPKAVALSIDDPVEPIVVALPLGTEPLDGMWYDYEPQGAFSEEPGDDLALHVADGLAPGPFVVFLRAGDGTSSEVFRGGTTDDGMLTFRAPGAGRFEIVRVEYVAETGGAETSMIAER